MSYPPPPGQGQNPYAGPNPYTEPNPYAGPNPYAQPQQTQAYGHPRQWQQTQQPQQPQQAYGYPQQARPPQQGYPAHPAGGGITTARMPRTVIAARVMLLIAGGSWAILFVTALFGLFAADAFLSEIPGAGTDNRDVTTALVAVAAALSGGMAALHLVPAVRFGRGRNGVRVTAIIAASLNTPIGLLAALGGISTAMSGESGNPVMGVFWACVAIATIVLCALPAAGQWFRRPRH